ncbi:MAG TPA: alpha/beta hydrolase [Rhizomicrobium sp.]|jgi:pimeloyl-ACP methyl ester carboxylesterase|nr:alpha/beta hydrolase [Rhizomicrobium sp.]
MNRLKDMLVGSLLALAIVAPNWAKADPVTVERPRFSDQIEGSGPDLIFIPGLASSRDTWKATAERLKPHYRVHLIQVAGFAGESARDNASRAVLVPTAEAIDAYLVEQHLTPATVIGHSMGGTMTLYLAAHHGDHYKKVLIVDALPFFGVLMGGPNATADSVKPIADGVRASASTPPDPQRAAQTDQMIAGMVTAPADQQMVLGWGHASDRAVVANAMADDMTLDLRADFPKIAVPVTLLYPDNGAPARMDPFYQAAFAPLPNKTLIRIDNSRHFIMLDQPAQFDAALDRFLKS